MVLMICGGLALGAMWLSVIFLLPERVRRFSLQGLLVVTTLWAIILGLGVWLAH